MARDNVKTGYRFLLVSNAVAGLNLGGMYLLAVGFGVYYLLSSIIAYSVALTTGFFVQKFWSFQDKRTHVIHWQYGMFVCVAAVCVLINTGIVAFLVELFAFPTVLAQLVGNCVVGVIKFLFYRFFLFASVFRH